MTTTITGAVNITHYTAYTDDIIADDALFNIFANTRLVLTGDDVFLDDSLAMAGQLRVRGPLQVSGLHLDDRVAMVNVDTVSQTGAVAFGAPSEPDDDIVTIRNIAGAVWDMTSDVTMSLIGGGANFVNLGLLEKTGGSGFAMIQANLRSLGTVEVDSGTLEFGGANSRFFGDITGSGAVQFIASNVFLDNMAISVADFSAGQVVVRGGVTSASVTDIGTLTLQNDATLTLTETATGQSMLDTTMSGSGALVVQGDVEIAYLKMLGDVELDISGVLTAVSPLGDQGDLIEAANSPTGAININILSGGTFADNVAVTTGGVNIGQGYPQGANVQFSNAGTFEVNNNTTNVFMPFENDGIVEIGDAATSGASTLLGLYDNVTGTGSYELSSGADLTFSAGVSAGQTVEFVGGLAAGAELSLGEPADFAGTVAGFAAEGRTTDTIFVEAGVLGVQFQGYAANSDGSGGTLMFADDRSMNPFGINLTGDYDSAGFQASYGRFGVSVTYAAPA